MGLVKGQCCGHLKKRHQDTASSAPPQLSESGDDTEEVHKRRKAEKSEKKLKTEAEFIQLLLSPLSEEPKDEKSFQRMLEEDLKVPIPIKRKVWIDKYAPTLTSDHESAYEPMSLSEYALESATGAELLAAATATTEMDLVAPYHSAITRWWVYFSRFGQKVTLVPSRDKGNTNIQASASPSGDSKRPTRPDLGVLWNGHLIFKGEFKVASAALQTATRELSVKAMAWNSAVYGSLPFLPCCAVTGAQIQFFLLKPGSNNSTPTTVPIGPH